MYSILRQNFNKKSTAMDQYLPHTRAAVYAQS